MIAGIEHRLYGATKIDAISLESLTLSYDYLTVFCKKYPPRKMPNSTHPEDDDVMYEDPLCYS